MKLSDWNKAPPATLDVSAMNGTEIVHLFHRYGSFSEATEEDSSAALEEIRIRADKFLESL